MVNWMPNFMSRRPSEPPGFGRFILYWFYIWLVDWTILILVAQLAVSGVAALVYVVSWVLSSRAIERFDLARVTGEALRQATIVPIGIYLLVVFFYQCSVFYDAAHPEQYDFKLLTRRRALRNLVELLCLTTVCIVLNNGLVAAGFPRELTGLLVVPTMCFSYRELRQRLVTVRQ